MTDQSMSTKKNGFVLHNVSEIQDGIVSPIWGYQDVPIIKLEDAIDQISFSNDDIKNYGIKNYLIKRYVNEAKESCKKIGTKLTLDESAAIYLYTKQTPIHPILNNLLRTENQTELKSWFSYLKLLITGLNKLPSQANTLVWRGVSSDISLDLSNFDTNYKQRWWTVNSCSKDLNVIKPYLNGSGTVFAIETVYGKHIAEYSTIPDEQEVILLPGARLVFEGSVREREDGLHVVHLKECTVISEGKHVMLSYHQNDQGLLSEIGEGLLTANIPIWPNEPRTSHNIRHSLTEGVEKATVVCCFLTPEYEQTLECQVELQYAQKQSKKIIACILTNTNNWTPSGWLKSIIDSCRRIEFDSVTNSVDSDYFISGLKSYLHDQSSLLKQLPKMIKNKSNYFFELIKYDYQRNTRIERLMDPAKSFSIEQSYINLALVKTKDQMKSEKKLFDETGGADVLGTYEEIYAAKNPIELKDIFKTCNHWKKQVLVFGRAGIGKSTFCRFVAYQWAQGLLWSEYELLIVIPLRRLTESRYLPIGTYSLTDLVKKKILKYKLSEDEEKSFEQHFNPEKTLWILDGYDEISENILPHLKDLLEELLATPHHILTSRPYQNTLPYDVQMEITGFTDQNIEQYVARFFDQLKDELGDSSTKTKTLLKFLQSNPNVFGVAHIPINLELICSIWSTENLSTTETLTITALYTRITTWLCRRYLLSKDVNIKVLNEKVINDKCHNELSFLQCLAFQAMKTNSIVIRPALLDKALEYTNVSLENHPHILNFGVLKSFSKQGLSTQIELDKDHYFIHLSFQEYLAARHVVHLLQRSSTNEAVDFIQYTKYDHRYALMFTFIAGFLYDTSESSVIDIFWNTLFNKPIDLVGIRHMQLIIRCLEATSDQTSVRYREDLLKWIAHIIQHNIYQDDRIVAKHLASYLRTAQNVACDKFIIDLLLRYLQCNETKIIEKVLEFIANAELSNPSVELTNSIDTLSNHVDDNIKSAACSALGSIGEKIMTIDLIDKLLSITTVECEDVRSSARDGLGEICEKTATDQVIQRLLSDLADENGKFRNYAWLALGNMGKKAGTDEVIDKLASALIDESEEVRKDTCCALSSIGETAVTVQGIDELLSIIKDDNEEVRSGAFYGLGKICKKTATDEVIQKLLSALADDNEEVRSEACYALGTIGEKAATVEAIDKLMSALADENGKVRNYACLALGNMGEKAATNGLINKLATVLLDENEWVKISACDALGKIGEKAATDELINKLASALADKNYLVKRSACNALGKIGEKAATDEVINKLASALADKNYLVKSSACDALGKIGEKAATDEVINKLASALADKNYLVKSSACDALGKIGEKAATDEVIDKLASALIDGSEDVRERAGLALGEMGEKAATNKVILHFVKLMTNERAYVYGVIHRRRLKKILSCSSDLIGLDPMIVEDYYLKKSDDILENIPVGRLLFFWYQSKNDQWLSVIAQSSLRRGAAVTIYSKKVLIYDMKEPVEVSFLSEQQQECLYEELINQARRYSLCFESLSNILQNSSLL